MVAQFKGTVGHFYAKNIKAFHEDVVYRRRYHHAPTAVRGADSGPVTCVSEITPSLTAPSYTCSCVLNLPGCLRSAVTFPGGTGLSTRCTSHPSTVIPGIGRDGQRFSHAPQPMHFTASTTGTPFTSMIAFTGQCRSQTVQVIPSFAARQRPLCHTACPTCVWSFSSRERGTIAPAGHTSPQREQSGRQ